MKKFIISIDAGTTSNRSILFDLKGKPIYYSQNKRFSIIFSSEIKPLISNNLIEKTINSSAIESYILFSGFNSKEQIINNVHAVEPGELIIFKDKSYTLFF